MTELPATKTKMNDWNRISRLASQPRDWRLVWWGMNCEPMVMMLTQAGARLNLHLNTSHKPFMIIPNCGVNTIRQTLSKLFTFNKYFFPDKAANCFSFNSWHLLVCIVECMMMIYFWWSHTCDPHWMNRSVQLTQPSSGITTQYWLDTQTENYQKIRDYLFKIDH